MGVSHKNSSITDDYYSQLILYRHIGIFIASLSLLAISFILKRLLSLSKCTNPGRHEVSFELIGLDVQNNGINVSTGQSFDIVQLETHKKDVFDGPNKFTFDHSGQGYKFYIEETGEQRRERKSHKSIYFHGFAAIALILAYVLAFVAVTIGTLNDDSIVHSFLFCFVVVFKRFAQVLVTFLSLRRLKNEILGGDGRGVEGQINEELIPGGQRNEELRAEGQINEELIPGEQRDEELRAEEQRNGELGAGEQVNEGLEAREHGNEGLVAEDQRNEELRIYRYNLIIGLVMTVLLLSSVTDAAYYFICHSDNQWNSRAYNESNCKMIPIVLDIVSITITAISSILVDWHIYRSCATPRARVIGTYFGFRLIIFGTVLGVAMILLGILNVFTSYIVVAFYAEIFYISFLQMIVYIVTDKR